MTELLHQSNVPSGESEKYLPEPNLPTVISGAVDPDILSV